MIIKRLVCLFLHKNLYIVGAQLILTWLTLYIFFQSLVPQEFALPNGDRVSINFQEVVLSMPKVAEKAVNSKTVKVYPAEVSDIIGKHRKDLRLVGENPFEGFPNR